jgi:hypothetical protein
MARGKSRVGARAMGRLLQKEFDQNEHHLAGVGRSSKWVVSAKKEETRQKRLDKLIEDSAHGRTLDQYARLQKSK